MARRSATSFEELIAEAAQHPTVGWDFSWLGGRMRTVPLPWDYTAIVLGHARRSTEMLDMGTGGGEWLAALPRRPATTVASEAWSPNVPVAAGRLEVLGVHVVQVAAAPDNALQRVGQDKPGLPFSDASFDLIVNRHESFIANEVARVLAVGGRFITQQLGDGLFGDFRALFGLPVGGEQRWTLSMAGTQLEDAGLQVVESAEGQETVAFRDVGALAWYLRMIPWTVPGFSMDAHRERLWDVHQQIDEDGELEFALPGFYAVAMRPGE